MIKIFLLLGLGNAFALWFVANYLLPEALTIEGGTIAYIYIGVVFSILNLIIKPILNLVTFPLRILTLGAIVILIHAIMLYLLQEVINTLELFQATMTIHGGIVNFLIVGVILGIINSFLHWFSD